MPRLQVRAVLCDLDGTLVDSGDAVIRAWTIWCDRHGLDPAPFLERCHGVRTVELMRHLAPRLDPRESTVEVEGILAELGAAPTPGASELTSFLPDGAWAVVTSSTLALAESRFRPPSPLQEPSVIITSEDVQLGKPDPMGYRLAAARLGVPPDACLVLEDAPPGVTAGKQAGMLVAGVLTTHPAHELRGADFIVSDLSQIRLLGAAQRPEGGWDLALNVERPGN